MPIILKIALIIAGIYLLKRIIYLGRVLILSKSGTVELSFRFFADHVDGSNALVVSAPFFDENKHFYIGFEMKGLHLGFTPYETMLEVLREYFQDSYLVQIVYDFWACPNVSEIPGLRRNLTMDGVEVIDGAILYNSEAIRKGCLEYGITDGIDLFYICPPVDWDKKSRIKEKISEWKKMKSRDVCKSQQEFFGSEGQLFKLFDSWQLNHTDTSRLSAFADTVFRAAVEKTLRRHKVQIPSGYRIPGIASIFENIDDLSDRENRIKIYFEDDTLIVYREQGKIFEAYTQRFPVSIRKSPIRELLSYFIPEVVEKKVYSKRRLRKLGIKYMILFGYMVGTILSITYINSELLPAENNILFGISFVMILLAVMALVLSFYYSVLGIFGKSEFKQAGI